jgi:phospholipase C
MPTSNRKINHVFVIMLENRSFDNLLGLSDIAGNPPITNNYNVYCNEKYRVSAPAPTAMGTDPGHEVPDVLQQLTNLVQTGPNQPAGPNTWTPPIGPYPSHKFPTDFANGTGFAASYVENTDEDNPGPPAPEHIGDVMKCFSPQQLPVLNALVREFAVCTRWHSSLPGPTWPNRFFLHLATSSGLDCTPTNEQILQWFEPFSIGFPAPKGTIFQALKAKKLSYRFYQDRTNWDNYDSAFSDDPDRGKGLFGMGWIPQCCSLPGIHYHKEVWEMKKYFAHDLADGYQHAYTFIEPHYGDLHGETYQGGSSQHPMDDVYGGEALVKFVYESLRNSPIWNESLLIITYDEHGGFYDSVPPPPAVNPNDGSPKYGEKNSLNKFGLEFDQLGVRVPAIIVSPWIPETTVDDTPYDHTSVPATLERLFGMEPLTDRDKHANDVLHLLSLEMPRDNCPTELPAPVSSPQPRLRLGDEEIALLDIQPLPASGNLIGAMGVLAKIDHELSEELSPDPMLIREKVAQIKTRGQLKAYATEVAAKLQSHPKGRP